MANPAVVEVNADDTADQVLERVIHLLRHHSIFPPCTSLSSTATTD